MLRVGLLLVAVLPLIFTLLSSEAMAKQPLRLGIFDGLLRSADAGERDQWFDRVAGEDSDLVLSVITWAAVAPADPPVGFDPADPADPAYNWGTVDDFVRDAKARDLDVILTVTSAPRWAEGKHRPRGADPGTWKPDAGELRAFAHAVAARYSGSFVDPAAPAAGPLPRVRDFQAWTEPNLPNHLAPQWQGKKARSPEIYRKLLNGFYAGVKSVSKSNRVITAGTAPYGDDPGGPRMRPLRFWRDVFCLRDRRKLKPTRCPAKAEFDVLAHHPINTSGPPRQSAINPDDVSSPDLGSLERTLRRAVAAGTVRPGGRKPLWVTEFWWESKPPAKRGWSPRKQARFIAESLYLFWKGGASAAVNLRIRDGGKGIGRSRHRSLLPKRRAEAGSPGVSLPVRRRAEGKATEALGQGAGVGSGGDRAGERGRLAQIDAAPRRQEQDLQRLGQAAWPDQPAGPDRRREEPVVAGAVTSLGRRRPLPTDPPVCWRCQPRGRPSVPVS